MIYLLVYSLHLTLVRIYEVLSRLRLVLAPFYEACLFDVIVRNPESLNDHWSRKTKILPFPELRSNRSYSGQFPPCVSILFHQNLPLYILCNCILNLGHAISVVQSVSSFRILGLRQYPLALSPSERA